MGGGVGGGNYRWEKEAANEGDDAGKEKGGRHGGRVRKRRRQ